MDPVTMVVIPGFLGGLALAAVSIVRQRRQREAPSFVVPTRLALSTDIINMATIKVAGIGGLGLVAMALIVAIEVPRVGQTMALGFLLGSAGAVTVILGHRRTPPLPTSSRSIGANNILAIDAAAVARS